MDKKKELQEFLENWKKESIESLSSFEESDLNYLHFRIYRLLEYIDDLESLINELT